MRTSDDLPKSLDEMSVERQGSKPLRPKVLKSGRKCRTIPIRGVLRFGEKSILQAYRAPSWIDSGISLGGECGKTAAFPACLHIGVRNHISWVAEGEELGSNLLQVRVRSPANNYANGSICPGAACDRHFPAFPHDPTARQSLRRINPAPGRWLFDMLNASAFSTTALRFLESRFRGDFSALDGDLNGVKLIQRGWCS